jgi:hypothetical protein
MKRSGFFMRKQILAVGIAMTCFSSISGADELKTATKGKAEPVQTYYGNLQSFEKNVLTFEVPSMQAAVNGPEAQLRLSVSQSMTTVTFKPLEAEIEIILRVTIAQDPIDPGDNTMSTPDRLSKDVDLQRKDYEDAKAREDAQKLKQSPDQQQQRDLRKCSIAGGDQVIEKDPDKDGKEKPPVNGKLISIKNGNAILNRASDGKQMVYRLDDLSRIIIGSCTVPHS